jgi:hypothetical protein
MEEKRDLRYRIPWDFTRVNRGIVARKFKLNLHLYVFQNSAICSNKHARPGDSNVALAEGSEKISLLAAKNAAFGASAAPLPSSRILIRRNCSTLLL